MLPFAEIYADYLKEKNLNFSTRTVDGSDIITLPYQGKNFVYIFSGDKGEYVHMVTPYEHVPDDKFAEVLVACNLLNAQYKWLKFYIDKDSDVMVEDDAIVAEENCAEECFELLLRRIRILDEVKGVIMKAIYG